jgi:sulfonate transport system permease protein
LVDIDLPRQTGLRSKQAGAWRGSLGRLSAYRSSLGLLLPILSLALWQAVASIGLVRPNLLPPPVAVFDTVWRLALDGSLANHVLATLSRLGLGFAAGVVAGTALGALTGYSATLRTLIDPTIQGLRSIPSIAWVPLFILWLGIAERSKIALIGVGVFFPVYLNLMSAIGNLDRKLIEVGHAFRLEGWRMILRIQVPAALPGYVIGLRGGLGLGWMFVVAAELMGASEGIGFLMVDGQATGRPALIIGALLLFALCGKATDALLVLVTRRALSWQDTIRQEAS